MKAKQYFQDLKRLDSTVKAKAEQIEQMRETMTSIGSVDYAKDQVGGTKNNDQICDAIARVQDLTEELARDIIDLCERRREAIGMIELITYADFRLVLMLRYMNCMTWERIACEMGFTFQWVQELNKRALVQVDQQFFRKVQVVDCS